MKKVDYIYQTVKNPHFVKNPGESAGFFKKTQKNPPGPGFFKILAGFANPDYEQIQEQVRLDKDPSMQQPWNGDNFPAAPKKYTE